MSMGTLTITADADKCAAFHFMVPAKGFYQVYTEFPQEIELQVDDMVLMGVVAKEGYRFAGWVGSPGGGNPASFLWSLGITNIVALFEEGSEGGEGGEGGGGESGGFELGSILVLGTVSVPQEDITDLTIHLGASKEVSSFELTLQNWNGKYSPSGSYPIVIGATGGAGVYNGGALVPLISLKVEQREYSSSPVEHYVKVSGRCWGERLFRRNFTGTMENVKGEVIVKYLLDNYVGLSHTRNGVELVEDTDTTYIKLEYEDTPVWDIIAYVAETADKAGVIGFDFRVAPDGRFEFFPKNSKTNSVSLTDMIESAKYEQDIFGVRNKITIKGAADKSYPENKYGLTVSLNPAEGAWSAENSTVSVDGTVLLNGQATVKCSVVNEWFGAVVFTFNSNYEVNADLYPKLNLFLRLPSAFCGRGAITLFDTSDKQMVSAQSFKSDPAAWLNILLDVGAKNADAWVPGIGQTGFDWMHIKKVKVACIVNDGLSSGSGDFWLGFVYFTGRRFSATVEDTTSQHLYSDDEPREFTDTDDELASDNECLLRAQALLDHYATPTESLLLESTVLDFGSTPILAADKLPSVVLPNEGVNGAFGVDYVEYHLQADYQELKVTLCLGRERPLLADYMYALKSKLEKINKYKVSK